jgi:signal transduction histidine kinase
VSQALYGIGLGARTARTLLDRDPPRAVEPLDYVVQLAEAGLTEMRALIFELRPDALETEGLVALLEKQADSLRARYGLTVDVDLGQEPAVSMPVKETLFRIAQETLNNVSKHAQATRVTIRLAMREDALVLEIGDNGVGFDPGASFPGHLGLRSMRERAARQGATIEIDSGPGRGTTTRVRVPAPR